METRQLGNSDLHITRIGFGAWAVGGSGWYGSMGPQNEDDSVPAIHAALDRGVYLSPSGYEVNFLSLAHSDELLERAGKVILEAVQTTAGS